jgi:hypothetical protein
LETQAESLTRRDGQAADLQRQVDELHRRIEKLSRRSECAM